jgi:hypothetical protein
MKYLNRLGLCASVDSHERYMSTIVNLQNKVPPLQRIIQELPLIITIDNLDWLLSNALVQVENTLSELF